LVPKDSLSYQFELVQFLADKGDSSAAQRTANELRIWLQVHGYAEGFYWRMAGGIALAKGEYSEAITVLEKALQESGDFPVRYLLGRAYLGAGEYDSAIAMLSPLTQRCPLLSPDPLSAMIAEYYLAKAYDASSAYSEAILHYERFAKRWRDASPVPTELADARQRLAALQQTL